MIQKFKEFTNNKEPLVFANAGGNPDHYKKFNPTNTENLVFANAGGNPDHYKHFDNKDTIKENLNPKFGTISLTINKVLHDPEKDNEFSQHSPETLGVPNQMGNVLYVHPHYTKEHEKNVLTLLNNTKLTKKYYRNIDQYTYSSSNLNSELYHAAYHGYAPPKEIDGINVKELDSVIKDHNLPESMTVYTGAHFNPKDHIGKIVRLPAYTSTSLTPHVAKDFGKAFYPDGRDSIEERHIIRIHLPSGTHHVFTDPGSNYPGQSELILPRNSRLQIGQTPTHTIEGKFYDHFSDYLDNTTKRFHFWTARLLPS